MKLIFNSNTYLKWARLPYPMPVGGLISYCKILLVTFFMAGLIYILKPFGLTALKSSQLTLLLSQIMLSLSLVSWLITEKIPRYFVDETQWKTGHQVLIIFINLFVAAIIVFAFTHQYLANSSAHLEQAIRYISFTVLLALPIIIIRVMAMQNQYLKHHLKIANDISSHMADSSLEENSDLMLSIKGEDGELSFKLDNFLFAKSEKNYIEFYLLENKQIKNKLLRKTMTELSDNLAKYTCIQVCHRSYLINLNHVSKVKGNSRGYALSINYYNSDIPVARSRSKAVLKYLKD